MKTTDLEKRIRKQVWLLVNHLGFDQLTAVMLVLYKHANR